MKCPNARRSSFVLTCAVAWLSGCAIASGQSSTQGSAESGEFKLDTDKGWVQTRRVEPNSDEAVIANARQLLAKEKWTEARDLLTKWIEENEIGRGPMVAEAYLLRGDAHLGRDREENALRDYEEVVSEYPSSEAFTTALEREFDIAVRYLNGMHRRVLGVRIDSGIPFAEEIILRINERLPGSTLAKKALLYLADYYYRVRDLRSAAEAYEVFLILLPKSEFREKAKQRRVYANTARFKGPKYDASGLINAKIQIERFAREYPADAERAGMSDALVARLDESAAAQMLDTARWYAKRRDDVGARLQCRKLLEKYPTSAAAERALEMMEAKGWQMTSPGVKPAEAVPETKPIEPKGEPK